MSGSGSGSGSRLNSDHRNQAIGMLGASTQVAFGVHRTTISTLTDKFANISSVKDRPRPGEPRKSTAHDVRSITLRVLGNQKLQQDLLATYHRHPSQLFLTP